MKEKNNESQSVRLKKIEKSSVITVIIGVVLLVASLGMNTLLSAKESEQLETTMYLNQYRMGSKTLTDAVHSHAATGEQSYYDAYMKELNEDKNRDIARAGLKENNLTDEEWQDMDKIAELSDGLVPLEEEAMELAKKGQTEEAKKLVFGDKCNGIAEQINKLTDQTIQEIQDRVGDEKAVIHGLQVIIEVLFFISFVYLIFQIICITKFSERELLKPIVKIADQLIVLAGGNFHTELEMTENESEVGKMVSAINYMKCNFVSMIQEISEVLEKMGEGDYNIEIHQDYVGEFMQIKESFLIINEKMREVLSTIREASLQIDSGSAQLAYAADDLATACTGQATEVSELMQLLTELGNSIRYNEQEAEEAVKISNLASSTLTVGSQKMDELREAMKEISQCSEQIISVIAAISDIGDEIDLLSLNASIESARAGEAGRGFAVVAEQVKKLAEASQNAVGQTSELIERTVQSVEVGTRISREAAANMEEVQMGAEETTGRINGIVDKLKLEVESIAHINDSIGVVAGIVDNNSATSEETAAVSEQQKAQVESMVDMMSRFKV